MKSNFYVNDGGKLILFNDCDDLRYYLYSINLKDNKPKIFHIHFDRIGCDHKGFSHHTNKEIVEYINEYLGEIGYNNYIIQTNIGLIRTHNHEQI